MEKYEMTSSKRCREVLNRYPQYKFYWRSGFAWKGAVEGEDDKQPKEEYDWRTNGKRVFTFEQRMERRYDYYVVFDITLDHDKQEIHMNGFSSNDMY